MIGRRELLRGGCMLGGAGLILSSASTRLFAGAPELAEVRGVYSAPGLSFLPIALANRGSLWAQSALSAETRQVQGGPLCMVAMTNREADFAGLASTDPIIGWDKGVKTVTIGAFTGALTAQFSARNDWMLRVGVSPKDPIESKLRAFKGARIGASTVGGGPAQYTRYLIRSIGLNPDRDLEIVAVGFGASRMAALRTGQVDVTIGDSPEADQIAVEGFGDLFINCGVEVPIFRDFPYTVLSVTPEFADAKPEIARRIAQTIGRANDVLHTNFGEAFDIARKDFPNIDPKALERSLQRDRDSYPQGARMTERMWSNLIKVASDTKMISSAIPSTEGVLWTNKFLD